MELFQTIDAVSRLLRFRDLSSRELVTQQLARIEKVDPVIGSYSRVYKQRALETAESLDKELAEGHWRGPLHGVPVSIKDIYGIQGDPFEIGMPSRKGMTAPVTATVVERLTQAGAVIVGRVHTTEGVLAEHTGPFKAPKNPWGLDRWVGVSSSGSGASTAACLAFGTLGSDTGGSIRMPSASNGITGLKPTWGRCSRYGVFELAASLDHVGPMTRSALDAGIMLSAIAGYDPKDPTSLADPADDYASRQRSDLAGIRIGVDARWALSDVSEAVDRGVRNALDVLQSLGAELVAMTFPDPEVINMDWFKVCGVQTAYSHGKWFDDHKDSYGGSLRGVIELGRSMSGLDYQEVILRRMNFRGSVLGALRGVDVMVIPGLPFEAPPADQMIQMSVEQLARVHRYTVPFTMSQLPTITMPSGYGESGLPVSVQIVGKPLSEKLLVRLGHAFQTQTDFHQQHPRIQGVD